MIETVAELGLDDLDHKAEDFWQQVDQKLKEHLNLSLETLQQTVSNAIKTRAEEVALDLPNIAPYGNYEALLEDNDSMAEFLKEEASKPENWVLNSIHHDHKNDNLLKFELYSKAVDDGTVLMGLVFTNKSGIIRHSFCQVDL